MKKIFFSSVSSSPLDAIDAQITNFRYRPVEVLVDVFESPPLAHYRHASALDRIANSLSVSSPKATMLPSQTQ